MSKIKIVDKTEVWSGGRMRKRQVGQCVCGREVVLDGFTNSCDCGKDYNMSGDLLAPRSQWGEETGETWVDCTIEVLSNAIPDDSFKQV